MLGISAQGSPGMTMIGVGLALAGLAGVTAVIFSVGMAIGRNRRAASAPASPS
jgi:hypothetical protein